MKAHVAGGDNALRRQTDNDPRQRVRCLRRLAREFDAAGAVWVLRGAPGELSRWCRARSPKDLDLWAPSEHTEAVIAGAIRSGGVPTCARRGIAGRRGVLSAMFMFLSPEGHPVGTIDISFGPPRAGAIEVGDEIEHAKHLARPAGFPVFSGTSVLTELILRRCVRGKPLDPTHVLYARELWAKLPLGDKVRFQAGLRRRFQQDAERLCITALAEPDTDFPWQRLRNALLRGAVHEKPVLFAEYAIDRLFFNRTPRRRELYPGGARTLGTTIAILGTDGTGKSSLVEALTTAIRCFGLKTDRLYFGRVRGGVVLSDTLRSLVERLLEPTSIEDSTEGAAQRVRPRERKLRWLASYAYVFDYGSRLLFRVLPLWAQNRMILMDRYVYDLHLMPHASATAARLAELISPRPRLMFFLDVDPHVILSRRQERTFPEVLKQQGILRAACERIGAGTRYVRVRSTAPLQELVQPLTRAAIATAHRREIGVPSVLERLLDHVEAELSRSGDLALPSRAADPYHG